MFRPALVFTLALAAVTHAATKPNIVILLADDLGWADVGFHGGDIRTPNLDSLAKNGVTLDQFHVQPTCTPTRTALMTGRYPFRNGAHISVLRAYHTHGIPLDERFLSESLHDAGYKTSITGKWHLGLARRAYWPISRGFDLQYGCLGGAIEYFTHDGYGALDWQDNDHIPLREDGYSTDLIGKRAVKVVMEHDFSAQPLFLYVPFNAPHTPLEAKPEDLAAYPDIKDKKRRTYAAMVTAMDTQIGNIITALGNRDVRDNTLIFFSSDNGGPGCAINTPLRGGKGTLYQGGVMVPALLNWPSVLKPGTHFDQALHIVDLFPTLTALAGGTTDGCKPLDGINFWPVLTAGQSLPPRDILLNVRDRSSGQGAIRSGKWKLIVSRRDKTKSGTPLGDGKSVAELFDLSTDPNEKHNLAAQNPELVLTLTGKIKAHGPEVGDASPYTMKQPAEWKAPADWSGVPD